MIYRQDQIFEVDRNGQIIRLPLNALTADEVLGIANGLLRAGREKEAQPLYHLQHALRNRTRTDPPPPGDAA